MVLQAGGLDGLDGSLSGVKYTLLKIGSHDVIAAYLVSMNEKP